MKKLRLSIMVALLMFTFISTPLKATETNPTPISETAKANEATVNTLTVRLQEIKTMDKSNMSASEKKELRKETRAIKGQMRQLSGGVYVSAGAVILIAVLLLLLL